MMWITFKRDKRMVIHATGPERKDFKGGLKTDRSNGNSLMEFQMERDIMHWLSDSGYPTVRPEDVGALTSAPMVGDDSEKPEKVWAFMAYAVTSIPTELAEKGVAILDFSEVEYFAQSGGATK